MKPAEVIKLCKEYLDVKVGNFRSNFLRMKNSISEFKGKAVDDDNFLMHNLGFYTLAAELPGYWDGSAAQRLLIKDIESNRHTKMKPKLLRSSRAEYQEFPLDVFRAHIHQETRSLLETNYWIVKRKKKARKAAAETSNEDEQQDLEFF